LIENNHHHHQQNHFGANGAANCCAINNCDRAIDGGDLLSPTTSGSFSSNSDSLSPPTPIVNSFSTVSSSSSSTNQSASGDNQAAAAQQPESNVAYYHELTLMSVQAPNQHAVTSSVCISSSVDDSAPPNAQSKLVQSKSLNLHDLNQSQLQHNRLQSTASNFSLQSNRYSDVNVQVEYILDSVPATTSGNQQQPPQSKGSLSVSGSCVYPRLIANRDVAKNALISGTEVSSDHSSASMIALYDAASVVALNPSISQPSITNAANNRTNVGSCNSSTLMINGGLVCFEGDLMAQSKDSQLNANHKGE